MALNRAAGLRCMVLASAHTYRLIWMRRSQSAVLNEFHSFSSGAGAAVTVESSAGEHWEPRILHERRVVKRATTHVKCGRAAGNHAAPMAAGITQAHALALIFFAVGFHGSFYAGFDVALRLTPLSNSRIR